MRVKDLKVNERELFRMLLTGVKEVQGRGGPFCVLTFVPDRNGRQIEARMWKSTKENITKKTPEMSVVDVYLTGNEYNGEINYIADTMTAVPDADIESFLPTGRLGGKKMFDYTKRLIENRCIDHPAAVPALDFLSENEEKFLVWPGALRVHHAYKGGLIVHMGTCAGLCLKFAPVVDPGYVRSIEEKENRAILSCIYKKLTERPSGNACMIARILFGECSREADHEAIVTKAVAMILADRIASVYPFLNRDLLKAVVALRGISALSGNILSDVISTPAADAVMVSGIAESIKMEDSETVKLLKHCLLVTEDNDRDPAIPEAFLAVQIEAVAKLAVGNTEPVRTDTMVISAAVHDIGKLRELSSDEFGTPDYAVDGNLFGHTAMSIEMFLRQAAGCGIMAGEITDVLHCIASHHGKKEWGALAEPETTEAKLVSAIDYIDSRMDIYDRCTETLEPGERDESVRKYIGNAVYRPAV